MRFKNKRVPISAKAMIIRKGELLPMRTRAKPASAGYR